MGKRILVQRRGRGGSQYRSRTKGKIAPAKYPFFSKGQTIGNVSDILHERGRGSPLAKIETGGIISYIPAVTGLSVGRSIAFGSDVPMELGNVLPLASIPEGTTICNIEHRFGDGGKIAKSPGTSAILFSKTPDGKAVIRLRSGKSKLLNGNCRASLGVISGGGRGEKPFLRAGAKLHLMRSRGQLYPRVRGVAMTSVYHPFGGGRHQHPGKPTTTSRNAPPGRKVGHIAAGQTGRGKKKRKSRSYMQE